MASHLRELFDDYETFRRWAGVDRENPAGLARGVCDHVLHAQEPTFEQMTTAMTWMQWYVSRLEPFFAKYRMSG